MGVARCALNHFNATAGPRLAQAVPTMQPCSSFPRNTGLVNPTSGLKCIIGCRNGCVLVLTLVTISVQLVMLIVAVYIASITSKLSR